MARLVQTGLFAVAVCSGASLVEAQTIISKPDLTATSLQIPSSVVRGTSMSVSVTFRNRGTARADSNWVGRVYLSADQVIDSSDTQVAQWTHPTTLAAGASTTYSGTVSVPAATAWGNYFVGVILDARRQIPELSEVNNALASTGRLGILPNVDLVVGEIVPPFVGIAPGKTFGFIPHFRNNGTEPLGTAVPFRIYLSLDQVLSADDSLVATGTTLAQSPNVAPSASGRIPDNAAERNYYLIGVVDPTGVMPETNEGNNTGTSGTNANQAQRSFYVGWPDLQVQSVKLKDRTFTTETDRVLAGDTLWVELMVRNGTSVPISGRFYHAVKTRTSVASRYQEDRDLSYPVWLPVVPVPEWPFPGSDTVVILLDSTKVVPEGTWGETNNTRRIPITVLPKPDLVPNAVSSLTPLLAGRTGTVRLSIWNLGGGTASSSWSANLYLMPQSAGASPVHIGTMQGVYLTAGQTHTADVTVSIPVTLAGNHALHLVVDTLRQVSEAPSQGEKNNTLVGATVPVIPVVQLLWGSSYPQPGVTIQSRTPVFAWPRATAAGVTSYRTEIEGGYSATVAQTNSSMMFWAIPDNEILTANRRFRAIIRAVDAAGQELQRIEYNFQTP